MNDTPVTIRLRKTSCQITLEYEDGTSFDLPFEYLRVYSPSAARDEFYSMGGNGEQTRAYDSFAKEWWVTFATVPGVVNLTPEPKPKRGSFTAIQNDKGQMVMTTPAKDANDIDFTTTVTFYEISDDGFEWKSENIYADKSINTGNISCRKVAGPGH